MSAEDAETLRAAAAKVREAATDAARYAVEDEWRVAWGDYLRAAFGGPVGEYAALMGPQVAEPLAAWLDAHGRDLESAGGKLSATDSPADVRHALDLARAILGGGE